jgi:adenine-specific DNA-methyltransferase
MKESDLIPLFRSTDVQLIADRLSSQANWHFPHTKPFQKGLQDIEQKRVGGEANTCEKIIEPLLYEVLGYDRNENDAEHAVNHAGAGGETGAVEYFFRVPGNCVPIEAKAWEKSLDKKDSSGRSPVRQAFDYAVLSNLRWFVVTNGSEWRLYKTQLKGSQSPLSACERYFLKDILENRKIFLRFHATFGREAFVTDREGATRLDELRRKNEVWQEAIGESLYDKLVESRVQLYRALQPQLPHLSQEEVNEAVVKLLFRLMFIRFAEDTPLLPSEFLLREILEKYEKDQKWGATTSLYSYIQQYFAWLDGRKTNDFDIYPYDGALFDDDPILDNPKLAVDDKLIRGILLKISREAMGRNIDYSQINPRILGDIYEKFMGFVIEIKQGRLDPQAERDTRRKEGSVYTPESVTKYLVEHCVGRALALNPDRKPWELTCIDPACGSGHFLVEYVNHVARLCEELDDSRSFAQWKRHVTEHCAFGVDKDRTAVMLTKLSLWINSAMRNEPFATIDTHVKCGNSLVSATRSGFRLADYEKRTYPEKYRELSKLRKQLFKLESRAEGDRPLLGAAESLELHRETRQALSRIESAKEPVAAELAQELYRNWKCLEKSVPVNWEIDFADVFEERGGFDLVLGNPPWGADLEDIRDYLEGGAFRLARGQYDSYELFVELGRRLLHERGVFGFIIPDSITQSEHEPLRRMLLEETSLSCLIRAGEGLFPSVYRAAFFLCFDNRPADAGHLVRAATLRKAHRKQLEADTLFEPVKTVAEIVSEIGHDCSQDEFKNNPRVEFDIFTLNEDRRIIERIDYKSLAWKSITTTGRGIELGKNGQVLQCPYCYRWDTMPAKMKQHDPKKTCSHCRREYNVRMSAKRDTIICEKRKERSWRPLLVGESVNRYYISKRFWINTEKDGINYKEAAFYSGKRLLVRKTGIGIMATIDDTGAYTNQVVFSWKMRDNLPKPLSMYSIEYILGILNSRLMLYRFYTKSGDTEWRSFPYMTQKTIQQLPIREIDFSNLREKELHDEISDQVAAVLASGKPPSTHEDYQIEMLVMQLYGITRSMCRRIFEVLHEVQDLRIIREMSIAEPDMLLDALPE